MGVREPDYLYAVASSADDSQEMFRELPWPFENDEFPAQLGAVVMRTVLDGELPALQIVHFPDNGWAVADGVNDPNEPGAFLATHIWHAIEQNSSLAGLASLPPGYEANRAAVGEPWIVSEFQYGDDD
jgi:hypothetical protein